MNALKCWPPSRLAYKAVKPSGDDVQKIICRYLQRYLKEADNLKILQIYQLTTQNIQSVVISRWAYSNAAFCEDAFENFLDQQSVQKCGC